MNVILLLLPALAGAQEDPAPQVRELIAKFRSERIEERDDAYRALKKLGRPALAEIEKASGDPDPEVSRRLRRLIRVIPLYEQAPGYEERLADGDAHEWIKLFLELAAQEPPKRGDLDRLVAPALRAAADYNEARDVCKLAGAFKLRRAVPELLIFLKRPDWNYRYEAVVTLQALGAKEAAPAILPLLEDPVEDVRDSVYDLILHFRIRSEIPRLGAGLKDPSMRVRNAAAHALGGLAGEEHRGDLVSAISHEDPNVRYWAAVGLGRLGGKAAVAPLLGLLGDPKDYVRRGAVEALARIGEAEAVPGLRGVLQDPEAGVVVEAITALVALDAPEAEREIFPLTRHAESSVREAAFRALAGLEARSLIPDVVKRLDDPDPEVRTSVLSLLSQLRARSALPDVIRLAEDPVDRVRWHAVLMLSLLRDVRAIPVLRTRLKDDFKQIRTDAARALGEMGAREAIPDLVAIFRDGDPDVRRAGALALSELRAMEALGDVAKLLDDPDGIVAGYAVKALERIGSRDAVPLLLKAFREGKYWTPLADALARLAPDKLPALARELLNDKRPEARHGAIVLLKHLPAEADRLIPFLKSADPDVRWAAMEAAVALGRKEAIPELVADLQGSEPFLRYGALFGLKTLGARDALDTIRPALNDGHWLVRSEAMEALVALGGKDVLPDLRALVKDPSSDVRRDAYQGLGKLGVVEDVRRGLLDEDSGVRWTSVEALDELNAKEAAPDMVRLLVDEHGYTRFAAARALAHWGRTEGVAVILKADRRLTSLNSLRRPELYARLRRTPMEEVLDRSAKQNVERVAGRAGLKVELSPGAAWEDELSLHRPNRLDGRSESATLLSALDHSFEPRYEVVLESDRIRVLSKREARKFWQEWAADKNR